MPGEPSRASKLSTPARWPLGIVLTAWRYMWRTTPARRREMPGSPRLDAPPAFPEEAERAELQPAEAGTGPFFHRRYRVRIREARLSPEELVARLRADLNAAAPSEFASFVKVAGEDGPIEPGDELVVRMPGPWDGPVRVVAASDAAFRLATLQGHLEAGQIEMRAERDGDHLLFTVESWARSGDRLSALLYERLRVAKEVQLHMWTSLIERVVELTGGRRHGALDIETWRIDGPMLTDAERLGGPERREALERLGTRGLNFDPAELSSPETLRGWQVDDRRRALPAEDPGEPEPGGSWETARRIMRNYELADPGIVRATYRPEAPLEGRDMLLELRFAGLRIHAGVRVGEVVDEDRSIDGRPARVWGWTYRTLEGHVEMGAMDWEVWKWRDTGEVEFRIHAISRAARAGNPFVRLGFRLFGRWQQVRFYDRVCERIVRLTEAELARGDSRAGELSPGEQDREPIPR